MVLSISSNKWLGNQTNESLNGILSVPPPKPAPGGPPTTTSAATSSSLSSSSMSPKDQQIQGQHQQQQESSSPHRLLLQEQQQQNHGISSSSVVTEDSNDDIHNSSSSGGGGSSNGQNHPSTGNVPNSRMNLNAGNANGNADPNVNVNTNVNVNHHLHQHPNLSQFLPQLLKDEIQALKAADSKLLKLNKNDSNINGNGKNNDDEKPGNNINTVPTAALAAYSSIINGTNDNGINMNASMNGKNDGNNNDMANSNSASFYQHDFTNHNLNGGIGGTNVPPNTAMMNGNGFGHGHGGNGNFVGSNLSSFFYNTANINNNGSNGSGNGSGNDNSHSNGHSNGNANANAAPPVPPENNNISNTMGMSNGSSNGAMNRGFNQMPNLNQNNHNNNNINGLNNMSSSTCTSDNNNNDNQNNSNNSNNMNNNHQDSTSAALHQLLLFEKEVEKQFEKCQRMQREVEIEKRKYLQELAKMKQRRIQMAFEIATNGSISSNGIFGNGIGGGDDDDDDDDVNGIGHSVSSLSTSSTSSSRLTSMAGNVTYIKATKPTVSSPNTPNYNTNINVNTRNLSGGGGGGGGGGFNNGGNGNIENMTGNGNGTGNGHQNYSSNDIEQFHRQLQQHHQKHHQQQQKQKQKQHEQQQRQEQQNQIFSSNSSSSSCSSVNATKNVTKSAKNNLPSSTPPETKSSATEPSSALDALALACAAESLIVKDGDTKSGNKNESSTNDNNGHLQHEKERGLGQNQLQQQQQHLSDKPSLAEFENFVNQKLKQQQLQLQLEQQFCQQHQLQQQHNLQVPYQVNKGSTNNLSDMNHENADNPNLVTSSSPPTFSATSASATQKQKNLTSSRMKSNRNLQLPSHELELALIQNNMKQFGENMKQFNGLLGQNLVGGSMGGVENLGGGVNGLSGLQASVSRGGGKALPQGFVDALNSKLGKSQTPMPTAPQPNASSSQTLLAEKVAPINLHDDDFASEQFRGEGNWSTNVTINDVLCGRGGLTNNHPGNVFFRSLVRNRQEAYLFASKRDKALVAHGIVDVIRNLKPPGRFLKKDKKDIWVEIGNKKSREKTSQALREKAPELMELLQKDIESYDIVNHFGHRNPKRKISTLPPGNSRAKWKRTDTKQQPLFEENKGGDNEGGGSKMDIAVYNNGEKVGAATSTGSMNSNDHNFDSNANVVSSEMMSLKHNGQEVH
eukprot:CAMPEP_0203686462 /NCGR_PEP_ID=MMETSP0090-20130426/49071_1 /ASSEMBLY_ACC=CAM_ASM_001088 /TAXON_ID=426623 /ORGANISM="Chaetoceros affinis, Strain CCMP159" /LENGTH=1187 /DNA_ID=CAMNT_0050555687 /DNA_START=453 /DNA_END=4016 /DNA_ORIENTATION=+